MSTYSLLAYVEHSSVMHVDLLMFKYTESNIISSQICMSSSKLIRLSLAVTAPCAI
jgi:hypothetical protein